MVSHVWEAASSTAVISMGFVVVRLTFAISPMGVRVPGELVL